MVLSKINSNISYPEIKTLDPDDSNFEADMYQILAHGVDIIIAIGHVKNTFEEDDILYYPIYLIKSNECIMQIGVYEILASESYNYTYANGDLNIEKNKITPLIYTFATKDLLLKERMVPDISLVVKNGEKDKDKDKEGEGENEDNKEGNNEEKGGKVSYEIPEIRKDIFILTSGVAIPKELKEETEKRAKDYKEKYHETTSDNWVQKFMQNTNYNLIDNEGGGDCLFSTIRDSFSSIAQQTTVDKLRKKVSEEVDDKVFQNYKDQYDIYQTSILSDTKKIKELAAEHVLLKEKFANSIDSNDEKKILENAKKIQSEHDKLVEEKKVSATLLKDFKFMKDVHTLEQLKKKVRTCDFWADLWTISTIEKILNVKFIILSSESYKNGDINILQCGETDPFLQNKGMFTPEFYILVDYTGTHYKTVSYKNKMIFKFAEIPYDIKKMIVDKCIEKNGGPFAIIPDFEKFKKKINKKNSISTNSNSYNSYAATNNVEQVQEVDYEDLNEAKLKGLYDDNIVFQFYSKSTDKLPGKGVGEQIPNNRLIDFKELASMKDWRKKLSNFWVDEKPFTLDNHKWASVEHYYQASKFKKNHPEFYLSFSLDSGTELSKDPLMAKAAGGKSGKYKGQLLRPVQVQIDPDFFGKRSKQEMYDAQYAKFSQIIDDKTKENKLKKILLATGNAKLTHFSRGKPAVVFDDLMIIRDKLKHE